MGKEKSYKVCERLKFDHTDMYVHKLETFLKIKAHKILWDLSIQADLLIPNRRPDLVLISLVVMNKKKQMFQLEDIAVRTNHNVEGKRKNG